MVSLKNSTGKARLMRVIGTCGPILAVMLGTMGLSGTVIAQDNDKVKAGLKTRQRVGCAECHGAFADGEKQRDESPTGANLRTTRLDAAALKEVIACGKPGGAGMPSFDEGAYKVRACYDQWRG